jgi:hypothetical protein
MLAESDGFVVLERGYVGTPVIYSNATHHVSSALFYKQPSNKLIGVNEYNMTNISPTPQSYYDWTGPYLTLPPGAYSVTFNFYTNDNSSSNNGYLDASAYDGRYVLNSTHISGYQLRNDSESSVTIRFYLLSFTEGIEFRGYQFYWNGTLSFRGVTFHRLNSNALSKMTNYANSENNGFKVLNSLFSVGRKESLALIKAFSGDNL